MATQTPFRRDDQQWGAVVAETFMTDPTVPMFICNLLGTTVGAAFEFYEKLDVMLVLVLTLWSTFRPVLLPSGTVLYGEMVQNGSVPGL